MSSKALTPTEAPAVSLASPVLATTNTVYEQNVADHVRLVDTQLSELVATAATARIRLRKIWSHSLALEQRIDEILQQNAVYAEQLDILQDKVLDLEVANRELAATD